jgi:hypothetical protein
MPLSRMVLVFPEPCPQGQTRWSKALVRHGADAREAIATVLAVPAEQIGVRDCA